MAKMRAIDAAVHVLEREGVTQAFGVPGAAINPLYSALRERQSIAHILARHVEAASHMAEGYTRAKAGNIGLAYSLSSSTVLPSIAWLAEATSAAGAVATFGNATATDAVGPVTVTYSSASGSRRSTRMQRGGGTSS